MKHGNGSAADGGELLYGTAAVARFLGVSQRRVGDLARDRGLPLHQVGLEKIATRRQVLEWLEAQPMAPRRC